MVGGSESFAVDEDARSRVGAETGGATTSVVCESCVRELARSRGVLGAGATTVEAIAFDARSFSAVTFGAGAITVDVIAALRRVSCTTSGAGATTLAARLACLRLAELASLLRSGAGGTGATFARAFESAGAASLACIPSAGGGPGIGLNASRFATAESLCGKFTLGASTMVSPGLSPRATLMVWVR